MRIISRKNEYDLGKRQSMNLNEAHKHVYIGVKSLTAIEIVWIEIYEAISSKYNLLW